MTQTDRTHTHTDRSRCIDVLYLAFSLSLSLMTELVFPQQSELKLVLWSESISGQGILIA